jgi:hypothetical protein
MKKIPIYIVTTPEGDNLVRTTNRATSPWLEAHPGYKVTTGWVYPRAAREIAAKVAEASGGQDDDEEAI